MLLEKLDDFCGGEKFWNQTLTWDTDTPDFTECFQKTALIWLPCAFLWLFTPLEIFYMKNSINRNIPYGFANVCKLLLTGALIILSIIDLVIVVVNGEKQKLAPVDYYTPAIKIATFTLSAVLLEGNRRFGLRTSGLQFLFWAFLLICGLPMLRTQITHRHARQANPDHDVDPLAEYNFTSYLIFYIFSLGIWILNCYADRAPLKTKYPKSDKPYPEQGASFLSRLLYTWFDPLAWQGYRRPLEQKDLWDMNPEDSSKEIMPIFLKYWDRAVAKASGYNVRAAFTGNASYTKSRTSASVTINPEQRKKKQASILPPICKAFGPTFLFGAILKLVNDLLTFVSPQLLRAIINFVDDSNYNPVEQNTTLDSTTESMLGIESRLNGSKQQDPMWRGILYAVLLFIVASTQTLFLSQYFQRMFLVGLRIRTALVGAIYKKALCLSNKARKESTVGEIVNLMAVDAQRFMDLTTYINMIWSAPLQIALALYFLWDLLGPSVLAGLAVMIILIPVNGVIANKIKTLQIRQMKNKDERVKLMNEILSGIKVLKLYAWETSFEEQVQKIREREIKVLKDAAYLNAGTSFIWSCAPFLVSLITFFTYTISGDDHILSAEKAFVCLALFDIIRMPLAMLPLLIVYMIETSVSVNRINKFMNSEELDPQNVIHDPSNEAPLSIENGTFTWGEEESVLKNINLQVKKNNLVAVVGSVGSGKSSIISAFLGEMDKLSGRVNTAGTIAYVSQQAWIQNATLQDNILFGKPMDRKRYNQVIAACALKPDLEMLPGGDATEIGEKGINLSGGQKQRVSLARAVYNDADNYFLDDPLSAVDAHVGKHIFENVIGPSGILASKSRLLVTHGITYLPNVDNIYVVKNGEISESGTLKELINKKGDFADFLIQHLQEVNEEEENLDEIKEQLENTLGTNPDIELRGKLERAISRSRSESRSETGSLNGYISAESTISNEDGVRKRSVNKRDSDSDLKANKADENGQKLIEQEKSEVGSVKWDVYKHYLKSIGVSLTILTVLLNLIYQGFAIGSSMWLSKWSNDKQAANDTDKRNLYLGVYAAFGLGQVFTVFLATLSLFLACLGAARYLHNDLLRKIMRAPMAFFDRTPLGRIINRLSHDVNEVDIDFPATLRAWVSCIFSVLSTLVVISVSTYWFMAVIFPIGIVYYFVQRFYVSTSRQLKRLESVSRSPIYSHFGESIQGAPTIRAYSVQQRFISDSDNKVDFNQVCYAPSVIANRWLAVRLEMVGNLIIFFAALFAVLSRNTIDPGTVGLSVSYALQITQTLNWLVRMTSEVETNIVAVERIKEYAETEQEAAWENPNAVVPKNWPEYGNVQFKNFEVRYREGLDLVLRGLTFTINGTEKVGIVGRTGAGKSSLTLALFRIIESAGGSIVIDGEDISKLGLHTLRSRLTIIPQDPVLFSGSLRLNLDPFGQKSDEEVWRALELAHLKAFVKGLTAGLNHEVTEGGENLSVGQRQLVCLARALLRKTKVLILDEATAAVDLETDDLIQKTIRSEFNDCTILTIAHRLNTIIDADKIIVLDKGHVAEFDSPDKLLANKKSAFYSMAKDAGLV
ncbi:multidrug resistance-associated protein 1 isoform X6 [Contarinia nasturtii]|uniref:multidrug resistance-associated protein 1 isoform X6 n=1 Tax=Contarinia nasturtii TaxID=265458 RepID=UPI0012D4BC75|nr:multidrug resistance-associated protein 1 isoform X6 [Contarinia nasturtii]